MDSGLDGVVVAETRLSDVDGQAGRLVLRGAELDALAGRLDFAGIAAWLWADAFEPPADAGPEALARALGAARVAAFARLEPCDFDGPPIEALRRSLARAPDGDGLDVAIDLAATLAVATAALARSGRGETWMPPDPTAGHAADTIAMAGGAPASPAAAAALDAYWTTVSDHGLNASTFAARVVASTRAGLTSAAIAGLSALKGPLHGGAPGPVLDMLDAIGAPERADGWIADALARGERLMGFGHRIYRVRDPRADALKLALARLSGASGRRSTRLELAESVETAALSGLAAARPGRRLDVNVEFYTAVLLDALGFDRSLFTCLFACGRIIGWVAHAREQIATGRLVRPASIYVGPPAAASQI